MSDSKKARPKVTRIVDETQTQLIYVQSLRFLAAAGVVIFHSIETGKHYIFSQESSVLSIFNDGYHGVDLFFVISGFIIYYSTHLSAKAPMSFLLRRVERIVPIYWFITISITLLAIVAPSAFKDTSWVNVHHVIELMFFVTFTSGQMPIVYVGWSLEYEMFFYLSVSFLLMRAEKAWDELTVIFSLLAMLNIFASVNYVAALQKFLTNPLMLEFIYGILAAKIFLRKPVSKFAIFAVILSTVTTASLDYSNRVISAGLPSAAIVLLAAKLSQMRARPSRLEKILVLLGDASYSIYLYKYL